MGYRNYSTEVGRIVDPNGFGDFTTIQAAIDASSSGETIYVRPGTYTENLTLKAGVNINGVYAGDNSNQVTVIGKLLASYSGSVSVTFIDLETNGDYAIHVTGANATILNIKYTSINATNADAIFFDSTNAASQLNTKNIAVYVLVNTVTVFTSTSPGTLQFNDFYFDGTTSVRSVISAGAFYMSRGTTLVPITVTGAVNASSNIVAFGTVTLAVTTLIIDTSPIFFMYNSGCASSSVPSLQVDGSAYLTEL